MQPTGTGGVRGTSAAVLTGVLLASIACVRYRPAPISPDSSLESLEARRLAAPAFGEFLRARGEVPAWPPTSWDLHLLTLAAFFFSPDLDVARAQWGVARGGVVTAGGRTNPTVTGGVGHNATAPSDQVTPWIPEVALDIPLDLAGKRGIRIRQARQLSEAARQNLLSAAWRVRGRVREAFLDVYVAREADSLLAFLQTLQSETTRILEAQEAAGEVSAYEVTQGRLALARSRLAVLEGAQRRVQAVAKLAEAIGVAPAALDSLSLSFDGLVAMSAEMPPLEIRRRALVNRSDIRAALADYEAAQQALRLEIRKQYPDVSIGPGYQLDQTDSKWTLSLSLPLPFPNRNRGPIAEALARRDEAAARFLALQSRVLAELEGVVASTRLMLAQTGAADTLLQGLQRQARAAESAYGAGELSRLQLLGVRIELVTTALARLDAISRAQQTVGALEDAMQSPLDMEKWTQSAPERSPRPPDREGGVR